MYAEKAASHWEGSIDLGDAGLWSNGLQRVPSGTLVVVGPLELNQQAWENSAEHLEMACLVAQGSGHRVAVLIETPTPASMFEDALLMVKMVQPEGDDCDEALIGEVAADGDLQKRNSFAGPRQHFNPIKTVATVDAIPLAARTALKDAIGQRTAGFLLFGASEIEEHAAIDLIAASLALTEHAGPAARIMPRSRSTPAKDWQVPEAIAQLPFLPSIESAFEQGIRRMVVGAGYTKAELLLKYGNDVLFICGAYDSNVDAIYMSAVRSGGYQHNAALLEKVIAILGVKTVPMKSGQATACDFYVPPSNLQLDSMKTGETFDFLRANRVLKWEDEMNRMLDSRVVTLDKIKSTLKGDRGIAEFLSARKARKPTATDER